MRLRDNKLQLAVRAGERAAVQPQQQRRRGTCSRPRLSGAAAPRMFTTYASTAGSLKTLLKGCSKAVQWEHQLTDAMLHTAQQLHVPGGAQAYAPATLLLHPPARGLPLDACSRLQGVGALWQAAQGPACRQGPLAAASLRQPAGQRSLWGATCATLPPSPGGGCWSPG